MAKRKFERLLVALGLILGCAAALAQPQRIVLADRIVAVVNNEVITQSDLRERVETVMRQLERSGTRIPPREVIEQQVLERMIVDRAQMQFARETGIVVDDAALDAAIARIAQNNGLSVADFRAALERDGIPYDRFREDVRTEMVLSRLREREINSRIQVSESEIDNFLAEQQREGVDSNIEFHLSHILIRVPEHATPDQLAERRQRAQEVRN
ncbi:MAG: SurA N-terminal domain-containing protein, partial [Burkholderiales bacterium]|nr:SurA N-terminal domain-containing protein [Burkholderiales bacterium]